MRADKITQQDLATPCYPNPSNASITIPLKVADGMTKVFVVFNALNGSEVAWREVKARGNTSLVLEKTDLAPGVYLYSLMVDGNIVDTKRLVRK